MNSTPEPRCDGPGGLAVDVGVAVLGAPPVVDEEVFVTDDFVSPLAAPRVRAVFVGKLMRGTCGFTA